MEEKEPLFLDYEELIKYVIEQTGLDEEIVNKVLDSENKYMEEHGFFEEIED